MNPCPFLDRITIVTITITITITINAPMARIDVAGLDAILPALFSARDQLARVLFG